MKTTATNQISFPTTAKLFVFVVLISGLAFLSCLVTNAQVSNETAYISYLDEFEDEYAVVVKSNSEITSMNMNQVWTARLERALVAETEEIIEVESWMLDAGISTEISEESLEVEDWMLYPDYFYSAETYEDALEVEPWMLDTQNFTGGETDEDSIGLEDWMLQ